MTFPITITALQYCLRGGLQAIPEYQASHPAGSILLLHLNGSGHRFPGSVSVEDEDFQPVGMVAAECLYRVRPLFGDIDEGGTVEAVIVRHEAKATICEVNGDSLAEPNGRKLLHADPEPGELLLPYTDCEQLAQHTANRVEQLLAKLMTDPAAFDTMQSERLVKSIGIYISQCDYSIAADDLYQRSHISDLLQMAADNLQATIHTLGEERCNLQAPLHRLREQIVRLREELHERLKDFKRKGTLLRTWEGQWQDICSRENELMRIGAGHFAGQYLKGWGLTPECDATILTGYHQRITQLLDQLTKGTFARYLTDREYFVEHTYYALTDRQTLYLLFGRILVWEHINQLIGLRKSDAESQIREAKDRRAALFLQQLSSIIDQLIAQCPARMQVPDPQAPGRMMAVAISIDRNGLQALVNRMKTTWKSELLDYLPTRRCSPEVEFSPSLPYLLLGWLIRHTTLFGLLPKKQMAQLLCLQKGCPYKPNTMETYLTKGIDDGLITDEYPLMLSISAFCRERGKAR